MPASKRTGHWDIRIQGHADTQMGWAIQRLNGQLDGQKHSDIAMGGHCKRSYRSAAAAHSGARIVSYKQKKKKKKKTTTTISFSIQKYCGIPEYIFPIFFMIEKYAHNHCSKPFHAASFSFSVWLSIRTLPH